MNEPRRCLGRYGMPEDGQTRMHLNVFDGDVVGITIDQAEANDPRRAIGEVKSGVAKFIEGKAQPMTAEQQSVPQRRTRLAFFEIRAERHAALGATQERKSTQISSAAIKSPRFVPITQDVYELYCDIF